MKILVTGGTGYIGSHAALELLNNNYEVVIIDNLCNSKRNVIKKLEKLTGKVITFYEGDVCNYETVTEIFKNHKIDAVMHFAGLKAVGESVEKPIEYYDNNINSTLILIKVMKEYNCKKIVFSSSATVYGIPKKLPLTEESSLSAINPYGSTKLVNEWIFKDLYNSDNEWNITLLRYFNPLGSEKEGLLGEEPEGIPNNLMPYVVRVAIGKLDCLNIYGDDYDTIDGTGVRDYIHVVDLAKGHIKALENPKHGLKIYNLGTGRGYSVLELVTTFEKVNNVKVNYKIVDRRPGDAAECYADASKAEKELNWKAEKGLEEMCRDSYNFILKNNEEK